MKTAGALSLLGNLAGQGLLLRNGAWHPHRAPATSLPPATVLFGAKAAPDEVQSIFRAPSSWNLPYELMPHLVLPPSRPLPLGRNVTSLVEAMEEAAAEPAGPVMVIGPRGTPKNELGILAHYGFLVEEEEEGRTRELGVELKVPGEEPAAPLFVVDCALEKEQVEQTLFGVRLGRRGGRGLLKYMEMHRRQLLDSDAPPPSLLLTNCHAAPEGLCARVAESLSRQESPPKLILTSEYPLEAPEVRLTVSVSELVVRTPSSVARHLLKECWTYADPPTPPPLLTRSAAALDRHDWPGNDEELRATVVRAIGAAVTSRASNITSEFLFPVAAKEKERVRDLLPFMMPPTSWFPVWGKSRYSMDLRDAIQEAAADRRSRVLIVGEAGLHKTDIASLIHQLSAPVQTCATGKAGGLLLRVQFDGQPLNLETRMAPLLRALNASPLGDACTCATVILTDVQAVNQQDLARLLTSRAWTLNAADEEASGGAVAENRTYARFILTSSKRLPQLEEALKNARKAVRGVKLIKLAPLRARKMDLPDELDYAVNCAAAQLGVPRPRITQEALRAIEAFPFSKDNIRELESMVVRALVQLEPGAELTEETLWPSERYVTLQRLRWNLFRMLPELWKVARSPQWPEALNYGFTRWAFLAGVAVLWWGPQGRDDNFVLNLFWAWWWPLVLLTYPLVGRLWCSVCPFMIWGETWQRALVAMGAEMRTWPRKDDLAAWSPWIMFTLFSAILLWEQLWDLEHTANLSGWLLVLITAGSVTASTFFEKRLWCRHLCPIGGMNGLYSKLAMTELRSNRGICSANCSTYGCFKGGPATPPQGMETNGCPLGSHPAQLTDNRDCTLCFTCVKACPHDSVQLDLRPPAFDIWAEEGHKPIPGEVALLWLLMGSVLMRRAHEVTAYLSLVAPAVAAQIEGGDFWARAGLAAGSLALPGLVAYGSHLLVRAGAGATVKDLLALADLPVQAELPVLADLPAKVDATAPPPTEQRSHLDFVHMSYGFLPLVWGGSLSHYMRFLCEEAGRVGQVATHTLGVPWLHDQVPYLAFDPAVSTFLQGGTLLFGTLGSVVLTRKIGGQHFKEIWPYVAANLAISALIWNLVVGN